QLKKLKDTALQSAYLSTKLKSRATTPRKSYVVKKLRSPHTTPRQVKRQRVTSPDKISNQEAEVGKALRCISRRQYSRGVTLLMKTRIGFRKAVNKVLQKMVQDEVQNMAKNISSCFNGGKSLDDISTFDWDVRFD
ncbi:hypothetical protein ACJMK2_014765, partial [Sinanodonta woodiana]